MQIDEPSGYACTFGTLKTVLYKYAFSDQERMNYCGRLKIEDIPIGLISRASRFRVTWIDVMYFFVCSMPDPNNITLGLNCRP